MFFNGIKKYFLIALFAMFIIPINLLAYSKYIIAGGENIGLQINNKGIIIVGFYEVEGKYPAEESNLNKGDIILKANNNDINSINDFITVIKNCNCNELEINYKRNNKINNTKLNLINDNNSIKTGLYVKDLISGIGTLSYIDPNSKIYGALGHEVIEQTTKLMVSVDGGSIYDSNVTNIDKSVRGEPGYKNAIIDNNKILGDIKENTKFGIFGTYDYEINDKYLYEVGDYNDIKKGSAKLITVVKNNEKKEYDINIIDKNNNTSDNKNILFEITDKELLNKTGGIVQGMSGSPIIQDNKIIGAVTNVVVNNPKKGYAVLITSMLKEGEN